MSPLRTCPPLLIPGRAGLLCGTRNDLHPPALTLRPVYAEPCGVTAQAPGWRDVGFGATARISEAPSAKPPARHPSANPVWWARSTRPHGLPQSNRMARLARTSGNACCTASTRPCGHVRRARLSWPVPCAPPSGAGSRPTASPPICRRRAHLGRGLARLSERARPLNRNGATAEMRHRARHRPTRLPRPESARSAHASAGRGRRLARLADHRPPLRRAAVAVIGPTPPDEAAARSARRS